MELVGRIRLTRKMILALGFILGLALPAGFILLINFFDYRIRTQEDIENNTQLPIAGSIMHNPDNTELTVFENPKSNIAESFRDLRTNLEFMLSGPQSKVISIHSTNPGEGKTFNSTNLATILAMNDNKVLLIGADMRKPKLHKIFKVGKDHGLSTCLVGIDTFEQVIIPTQIENLYLLPSGPIPPNPAEILSKPAMKNMIEMARSQFDYIIIDNCPVAMVTDEFICSRVSDLNIFILRYGVSHKHQLEIINQYADTKKVNDIGIIVNDIKVNSFGYTYYKYYQYEAYKKDYYAYSERERKNERKRRERRSLINEIRISMIIAVDFDGTIVGHRFPEIGSIRPFAFETLLELQKHKHKLILWTHRSGHQLEEAIAFCRENGLTFYAVNRNYPEEKWSERDSRKILADIYIDDRNLGGLPSWGEIYQMICPEEVGNIVPNNKPWWRR